MENSEIIELYLSFKDDSKGWLGLHHAHFTRFIALVLAVLTASLAATYKFIENPWVLFSSCIGPLTNIFLCYTGINTCDRFYQRFLEHEAIANKLFSLIDFDLENKKDIETQIFPNRWITAQKGYETIDKFVEDNLGKGANKLIRRTFITLRIVNIMVAGGILSAGLLNL